MNVENVKEKRAIGVEAVSGDVQQIRKEDISSAMRKKIGKALGPDEVPVECWKCLGETAVEVLTKFFYRFLKVETVPNEWRSTLIPFVKKKNAQDCSYHRGIRLMSH